MVTDEGASDYHDGPSLAVVPVELVPEVAETGFDLVPGEWAAGSAHCVDRQIGPSLPLSADPSLNACSNARHFEGVNNGVNIGVNISVTTGASHTSHVALGACPAAVGGG